MHCWGERHGCKKVVHCACSVHRNMAFCEEHWQAHALKQHSSAKGKQQAVPVVDVRVAIAGFYESAALKQASGLKKIQQSLSTSKESGTPREFSKRSKVSKPLCDIRRNIKFGNRNFLQAKRNWNRGSLAHPWSIVAQIRW